KHLCKVARAGSNSGADRRRAPRHPPHSVHHSLALCGCPDGVNVDVDLETGAIVAVTVQGADRGDTTTIVETAIAAAEQVEEAQADVDEPQPLEEIIGDKGYHSNQSMVDLEAVGIRSYIAEPDRGRRDWSEEPDAQAPVYRNRRRIRGPRGRRLMRQRGERIERSFAHLYDTGGMRRTHL